MASAVKEEATTATSVMRGGGETGRRIRRGQERMGCRCMRGDEGDGEECCWRKRIRQVRWSLAMTRQRSRLYRQAKMFGRVALHQQGEHCRGYVREEEPCCACLGNIVHRWRKALPWLHAGEERRARRGRRRRLLVCAAEASPSCRRKEQQDAAPVRELPAGEAACKVGGGTGVASVHKWGVAVTAVLRQKDDPVLKD